MMAEGADADLIGRLCTAARIFVADLEGQPEVKRLNVPDFRAEAARNGTLQKDIRWRNDLFAGRSFRQAHVEFFSIAGQIGIVHVCVFPHLDRNAPIFGFDLIAGRKKATGAFLDLSPTTGGAGPIVEAWAAATIDQRTDFAEKRSLPRWAEAAFSPEALAIRPVSSDEVERALELGRWSLGMFLGAVQTPAAVSEMRTAQSRYIAAQRCNEHTFRMLAGCVGAELARKFIDGWLFPDPPAAKRSPAAGTVTRAGSMGRASGATQWL